MTTRLLLLGSLMSSFLFAQDAAVLSGTVIDSSGAAIAGAAVSVTNTQTGVRISATSNEAGVYLFPPLQPGVYRLTAEHAGFKRHLLDDVTMNVGDKLNINV